MPEIDLKYMLIELKTGKSYVAPVELSQFKYYTWASEHIRPMRPYPGGGPRSYYCSMPILLEDYKIPSNMVENLPIKLPVIPFFCLPWVIETKTESFSTIIGMQNIGVIHHIAVSTHAF